MDTPVHVVKAARRTISVILKFPVVAVSPVIATITRTYVDPEIAILKLDAVFNVSTTLMEPTVRFARQDFTEMLWNRIARTACATFWVQIETLVLVTIELDSVPACLTLSVYSAILVKRIIGESPVVKVAILASVTRLGAFPTGPYANFY